MKITGSYEINADRETVWKALNDPAVLRECIPGCDSLEETAENELTAAVTAKVGPVKAKFTGVVELKDLNPPQSYRIEGSGKGGAAGFAKGGATVTLTEVEGGTQLDYEADAQVGGKLAQIGARLIDGTAKKMADQFFAAFRDHVGSDTEANGGADDGAATDDSGGDVELRVEGQADVSAVAEPATPDANATTATVDESVAKDEAIREAADAAAAAGAPGMAAPPPPDMGASSTPSGRPGIPAWVWFIGAVGLIIVLVSLVAGSE